jgi:hypothetical protein
MESQLFDQSFKPFAKMLADMISENKSTSVLSVLASIYTSDESNRKLRYSGLNGVLSI